MRADSYSIRVKLMTSEERQMMLVFETEKNLMVFLKYSYGEMAYSDFGFEDDEPEMDRKPWSF